MDSDGVESPVVGAMLAVVEVIGVVLVDVVDVVVLVEVDVVGVVLIGIPTFEDSLDAFPHEGGGATTALTRRFLR